MTRILAIFLLISCGQAKTTTERCEGKILDLQIDSFNTLNNKILDYSRDNGFITINDTADLLQIAKPNEISYYFQPSAKDPSKRKYTLKLKRGVVKTTNYEIDVLMRKDNDVEGEDILFWLKSYDNNRNQVGHLDFAQWLSQGYFSSGRIDCDTTLHMILEDEHRIFKVDSTGAWNLIKTIEIKAN